MRKRSSFRAAVGVVLAGAISSCAYMPAGARDPGSWKPSSDQYRAAYQIAAARCDRRTPACDASTGVHYASRDACIAAKLPKSAEEADLDVCASYALRVVELDQCVAEIKSGQCGSGLAGASTCRGKDLCPWDMFDVDY